MKNAIALAILVALCLAAPDVQAHHSHTDFFLDRDTTLEGTIATIHFQNPHVLITVRTAGSTLYTAEWQGAQWLQSHPELVSEGRGPVRNDTLKPGDHIVVVGSPPRDATLRTIVNLKEVRRPIDGWRWTCRRSVSQSAC